MIMFTGGWYYVQNHPSITYNTSNVYLVHDISSSTEPLHTKVTSNLINGDKVILMDAK